MAERAWRAAYEGLRATVMAGETPEGEAARRLARYGLGGLATARPAWTVSVSEAPEVRWTWADPRLGALTSAYSMLTTGGRS